MIDTNLYIRWEYFILNKKFILKFATISVLLALPVNSFADYYIKAFGNSGYNDIKHSEKGKTDDMEATEGIKEYKPKGIDYAGVCL